MTFHRAVLAVLGIFMISCSGTDETMEPMVVDDNPTQSFTFSDGFEGTSGNFDALFPENGSRWTGVQLVNPMNKENLIGLTDSPVFQGEYSLSLVSAGSDEILSKIDLEKGGLRVMEGRTIRIGAHFFIESQRNIENLLLIDVECCSCWDSEIPNNQCPGRRLMMAGGNDYLSIERGKIGLETLSQNQIAFPRNEWVKVEWLMQLSTNGDGTNQLYINDNLAIDTNGSNMPNPSIFRELFAEQNIDFNLQTPVIYERVQVGATANPTEEDIPLYIDDFYIEVSQN